MRAPRLIPTLTALAVAAAVAAVAIPDTTPAVEAQTPAAAPQLSSGAGDQVDLALTVYNGGLALVRDVRNVQLPAGELHLRFEDIAATVNAATVHLRSLSHPGLLPVLEQNYEYDLLDPQKLLQKYVGREVTLVRTTVENGASKTTEVKATLLALNNGPVWRIGTEIVTGIGADHYRFPELPDTLYSRPTLVWELDNTGPRAQKIEAAYLAANLSWSSDYVLTVDERGAAADLDGWVTLQNKSGTAFRNASLQLIAGDLHKAEPARMRADFAAQAMRVAESRDNVTEEAFSEYHLYSFARRTSIQNAETKQLSLLHGQGVPVTKRFVVDGQTWYYRNQGQPGAPWKDAVKVFYDFRNTAASHLGQPLPAGTVRVYQTDPRGQVQYVGEDRIGHTPKDEPVAVEIGAAFDIVSEHQQTDYKDLGNGLHEFAYEVVLRNHKDTGVTVEVNEPVGGDWTMVAASHQWTKTAAFAARFAVPVNAGGEARLRYRVRVKW